MQTLSEKFANFSRKILSYDHDFIFKFFGFSGLNFYNFISRVDSDHPDLDSLLNEDHELFYELSQLCSYLEKNDLILAQKFIIKNIEKYNFNFGQTTIPDKSQMHARFLLDKEKTRSSKKKYKFCSKSFNKDLIGLTHQVPNDLDLFKKNNKKYEIIIKDLKRKKERYKQLRCYSLSECISKSIELLEQKDHKGHRMMSISIASIFAATINNIIIDEKYQPSVYPIFEFKDFFSLETKKHIEEAENKGFPHFDHYLVVVPSFVNSDNNDDFQCLVERKMQSLVLGEKDGFCYFICLW